MLRKDDFIGAGLNDERPFKKGKCRVLLVFVGLKLFNGCDSTDVVR